MTDEVKASYCSTSHWIALTVFCVAALCWITYIHLHLIAMSQELDLLKSMEKFPVTEPTNGNQTQEVNSHVKSKTRSKRHSNDCQNGREEDTASENRAMHVNTRDEFGGQGINLEYRNKKKSSYVRWGRTSCPFGGYHYFGVAVGMESHFSKFAGGQDLQCVAWYTHTDSVNSTGGQLFEGPVMSAVVVNIYKEYPNESPPYWHTMQGRQLPCAVCISGGSTVITEYGQTECRHSWSKLYPGYAMAPFRAKGRVISSGVICVDERPSYEMKYGQEDRFTSEFSFVRSGAGFREENKIVRCVVCTSN